MSPKDQDKTRPLSTLANLAIIITDVQDMDPIFINLPYSTNIHEHSPPVRASWALWDRGRGPCLVGQAPLWQCPPPPRPEYDSDGCPSTGKNPTPSSHDTPPSFIPRGLYVARNKDLLGQMKGSSAGRFVWGDRGAPRQSSRGWKVDLDSAGLTKASVWLSHVPDRPVGQSACLANPHCPGWQKPALCSAGPLRLGSSQKAHSSGSPS